MPDKRSKRFRNKKQEDKPPNGLVILAKRTDERQPLVQPKILLKSRNPGAEIVDNNSVMLSAAQAPIKTIIIQRSVNSISAAGNNANHVANVANYNATQSQTPHYGLARAHAYEKIRDESTTTTAATNCIAVQTEARADKLPIVPQMNRPTTLITSMGILNFNARKMMQKENTNFLVVGVIGAQGVGKSTVLNLLASDPLREVNTADANQAQYERIFRSEETLFSTKIKMINHARTTATQMYITANDRLVLIDAPPLLHNSHQKTSTNKELDDLQNAVNLLSICHLLVIVYVDCLSIEVVRLLRLAMLMKPQQLSNMCVTNYAPNVLFIKNRAKRCDYLPIKMQRMDNMLKALFCKTGLQIFRGPTGQQICHVSKEVQKLTKAKLPTKEQQQQPLQPTASTKDCDDESKQKTLKSCVNEPIKDPASVAVGLAVTTSVPSPLKGDQLSLQQQQQSQVNSFLLPELSCGSVSTYHGSLYELTATLRERVLATTRNKMNLRNQSEFSEEDWFENLTKVVQMGLEHFDASYADVMQQHLEFDGTATTSSTSNNNIASQGMIGGLSRNRDRNKERKAFRLAQKP